MSIFVDKIKHKVKHEIKSDVIENIKTNRNVYIAYGVGVVVGAVSVLVVTKSDVKVTQKAVNVALINWKPLVYQIQSTPPINNLVAKKTGPIMRDPLRKDQS